MISALSHFICMKGMENLSILDDRLQFLSINYNGRNNIVQRKNYT